MLRRIGHSVPIPFCALQINSAAQSAGLYPTPCARLKTTYNADGAGSLLEAGFRFNEAVVLNGLGKAVEGLAQSLDDWRADKVKFPIVSAVGVAGQGKTGVLSLIHQNQPVLLSGAILQPPPHSNPSTGWLDFLLLSFNSVLDKKCSADGRPMFPRVKSVKAVMATFNQGTTNWQPEFESKPQSTISARLMADCRNQKFRVGYDSATLADTIATIRTEEAKLKNIYPKEVLIVVLVDEIRRITSKVKRRELVKALGEIQQAELRTGNPYFSVVTCLDLTTIFATSMNNAQRPVCAIPLHPATPADLVVFENALRKKMTEENHPLEEKHKYLMRLHVTGTGGHYRTLENLWAASNPLKLEQVNFPDNNRYLPHLLHLLTLQTQDRNWLDEGVILGGHLRGNNDLFAKSMTLSKLADWGCGVVYSGVNERSNLVRAFVQPVALRSAVTHANIDRVPHLRSVALF